MSVSSSDQPRPIFLLGVGRCGSTFQQIQLSRLADVWIWGEHDGVLRQLFAWGYAARGSDHLSRFSFQLPVTEITNVFERNNEGDAVNAAWLNGFRPLDIHEMERTVIQQLFTRLLPTGKKRWGFKEIRYGPQDRAAERLLHLFPESKIIHTVRNPFATIESSIMSWNIEEAQTAIAEDNKDVLEKLYAQYASRWNSVTKYFLDLEERHPKRVRTSLLEDFESRFRELIEFLDIECAEAVHNVNSGPINSNKAARGKSGPLVALRERFRDEIAETAQRAGYKIDVLAAVA